MGKTIIQTIGPLYGESVNGTVFGRPNGSIYIPSSNTITATIADEIKYIRKVTYPWGGNPIQCCTSAGAVSSGYFAKVVAESQDVASYIGYQVEDGDGEVVGTPINSSAGSFNKDVLYLSWLTADADLTDGASYTLVFTLYSSNGVPVAVTRVPVVGVVVS